MKRMIAVLLAALLLFSVTAVLADEPDSYVRTGGWIPDVQSYPGTYAQAYLQILNNHSMQIHLYQNLKLGIYDSGKYVEIPCKPVALTDITGDGIPELFFMETQDTMRGDLYVYSYNGSATTCVLFVPGITRIGYDDMQRFEIYLSARDGGTLVLEYYEYEKPWCLQLTRNAWNQYTLLHYYTMKGDYSGEGDDVYYRDSTTISMDEYEIALENLQTSRQKVVSEFYAYMYTHYGLDMDFETAVATLNGTAAPATPATTTSGGGILGLTIDKLATRKGPGTQYEGGGTYSVKGQWIKVLSRAYDKRNGIWWVKCEIPYHGETRVLWTGWKRFDHSTINLEDLPEEVW